MTVVPAAMPFTKPDKEPIVATAGLVLVQVPPVLPVTVSVVVLPTQTFSVPVMVPGLVETVIVFVALQPVDSE